ncbi:class I SAM-dependent methyltransferase [Arsukibacterium sp.]|uniref:class I SAM-dependent methyltransferase n=1 Tax=Arsukibacterium sp. TaxID=1977258 RepID=UPI002FD89F45
MQTSQHWNDYWLHSSSLSSFAEGTAAAGYQGELLAFWQRYFAALAPAAILVDIGTGNGAIAVAARQFSNQQQLAFDIHATDAANINPLVTFAHNAQLLDVLKQIKFYPCCPAEQLPFPDNSINLITSQFALEYANIELAVTELLRVLAPMGTLVAVMHHNDTQLAQDCLAGIKVLQLFLEQKPFFECARQLISSLIQQQLSAANPAIQRQCQQHNQQLLTLVSSIKQQLKEEHQLWFTDVMAKVAKLIMQPAEGALQALEKYENQYKANLLRLLDQRQAAFNADKLAALQAFLQQQACHFSLELLEIENQLFGQVLIIQK